MVLNPSIAKPFGHPTYLTGANTPGAKLAAADYPDLGILITPDTKGYLRHIDNYATFAVDNGVFGGKFEEHSFRRLIGAVAAIPGAGQSCLFVVAPDVFDRATMTGDALATLERSAPWFKEIRALGLPAALVAQDGLEDHPDKIPWDEFDVLFIGGGDAFKEGYRNEPPLFSAGQRAKWQAMMATARAKGKRIHVGRVNGVSRLEFAHAIGADSVDGTFLAFGPQKNLPKPLGWLNRFAPARAELGIPEDYQQAA